MKTRKLISVFLIVLVLVGIASFVPGLRKTTSPEPDNVVNLVRPAFLQTAHAQEGTESFDVGQMLDDEAGISAYFQTGGAIDLDLVRDLFSTIEIETAEYIVGSIPVPNYPEVYDNHVYVHVDGWIMAYYFNTDPVAKIIDVKGNTIVSTLLKNTVALVAGAAGMSLTNITYYDFRYPNATNMMFISELADPEGNNFIVNIPSTFGYSERSWSVYATGCCYMNISLDSSNLGSSASYWDVYGFHLGYGYITPAQMLPDSDHTIELEDYGTLVVIYTVP
ncbi:MAG: hypothetical protein H6636_09125 [Anaerolineales bacterium]|nr:hypothetical protein [Anaerolineales bacterium]